MVSVFTMPENPEIIPPLLATSTLGQLAGGDTLPLTGREKIDMG